jgi:hypothetical protein
MITRSYLVTMWRWYADPQTALATRCDRPQAIAGSRPIEIAGQPLAEVAPPQRDPFLVTGHEGADRTRQRRQQKTQPDS